MDTLKIGDKVRIAKDPYLTLEQHQAEWTVRVILGDYAVIENPQLGTWRYRINWLKRYGKPEAQPELQFALAA